jgi:hypothetical protein
MRANSITRRDRAWQWASRSSSSGNRTSSTSAQGSSALALIAAGYASCSEKSHETGSGASSARQSSTNSVVALQASPASFSLHDARDRSQPRYAVKRTQLPPCIRLKRARSATSRIGARPMTRLPSHNFRAVRREIPRPSGDVSSTDLLVTNRKAASWAVTRKSPFPRERNGFGRREIPVAGSFWRGCTVGSSSSGSLSLMPSVMHQRLTGL